MKARGKKGQVTDNDIAAYEKRRRPDRTKSWTKKKQRSSEKCKLRRENKPPKS